MSRQFVMSITGKFTELDGQQALHVQTDVDTGVSDGGFSEHEMAMFLAQAAVAVSSTARSFAQQMPTAEDAEYFLAHWHALMLQAMTEEPAKHEESTRLSIKCTCPLDCLVHETGRYAKDGRHR